MIRSRCDPTRPPHPAPNVRDDRETPLLGGGTGENVKVICPTTQAGCVRQTGTTGNLRMRGLLKLPVVQARFCIRVGPFTPAANSRRDRAPRARSDSAPAIRAAGAQREWQRSYREQRLRRRRRCGSAPPPTHSNAPPPHELEQMLAIARKYDIASERDARNRSLGRAGEERVLAHERAALLVAGRTDLVHRLRWVSDVDGEGAGYDIKSLN